MSNEVPVVDNGTRALNELALLHKKLKSLYVVSGINVDGDSITLLHSGSTHRDAILQSRRAYNFKTVHSCQSVATALNL